MTIASRTTGVHVVTVTDRTQLTANVVLLGFDAPELCAVTSPGQFVMVAPPGGERAACALGIYQTDTMRASVLFFVVGKRTRELSGVRPGDTLVVTGPLGNGFALDGLRNVGIVAGGVGIASVLLPAQALLRSGAQVRLYYGARSAELLVERERFAHAGCDVRCATDDGSDGHRGFVTDLVERYGAEHDAILACGPTPMLRATARIAETLGVNAQLSLEETFACGVGGCWGCVVPLLRTSAQAPPFPPAERGGSDVVYARVCKEGPVFFAHELRW
jgi:dihydroorotate dehydrogenase electron transfer subunit